MKKYTNYPEINKILFEITESLETVFRQKLVGVYLFGSLTYDAFVPERSDIDFMTILSQPASDQEIEKVHQLHKSIEEKHPEWQDRIENSLTPVSMLQEILPPKAPRPYYGAGKLYKQAPYGNEWIINLYLLQKYGITLYGKEVDSLIPPIDFMHVQEASKKDFFQEWAPILDNSEYIEDDHNHSYLILNLCRILYTVLKGEIGSKVVSANWVKSEYPRWKDLISRAEKWKYGDSMQDQKAETLKFLAFCWHKLAT